MGKRTGSLMRCVATVLVVLGLGLTACADDSDDRAAPTTSAPEAATPPASAASSTTAPSAPRSTSSPAASTTVAASPSSSLLAGPVQPVPPLLDEAKVDNAVGQIDGLVQSAIDRTGLPGAAVAVVYRDEVIFAKGYGVREVGRPETVDPDTVFQVASVSKPLTSTVIAGVVGQGKASWTTPVVTYNPEFALSDPYVTANATLSDLLSHSSGLNTGAGDLLEDLGWDRDYILGKLDQQPLDAFRSTYNYSNFGITEAGQATADAMAMAWEDLAQETLFGPLGMTSTSYRHADYEARTNKALIHVEVGAPGSKQWDASYVRNADAEAPAGGVSSSVNDLAKFVRLQLGAGSFAGTPVVDPAALQVTHVPHQELSQPTTPGVRTQFYGLCWNVTTDDEGRVKLDHSGAFRLGAATNVMLMEGEQLGIVTLTNGMPLGIPEAINNAFFDAAQNGQPTVDWLEYYESAWRSIYAEADSASGQYTTPPASPTPALDLAAYAGPTTTPTTARSRWWPATVLSR